MEQKNQGNRSSKCEKKSDFASRRKKWLSVTALVVAAVFLIWTVAASLISVWASDSAGVTVSQDVPEMRGVWVSTVMNLDYPSVKTADPSSLKAEADSILDGIKDMNMNNVFLQVRPCGDAFYSSDIFPWSSYITGTQGKAPSDGFDPLEYWVSAAHSRGLKLHAWINPYRITRGGDAEWNALSADNPAKGAYAGCVVKYSDGNYYYDPGNPDSVELIVKGALEIVNNYDVDGIHMDDYFYPGPSFNDDASWQAYGSGFSSREDWRRDNVNRLVAQLDTQLHAADGDIIFGISPQGIWANSTTLSNGSATKGNEAYTQKFADCLEWINAGTVDYIAPQIYWNIGYAAADYRILAEWWSKAVEGTDVDLYIGMADYRSSNVTDTGSVWYGTAELERQLEINRADSNIKGEIHFRYKLMVNDSSIKELYRTKYASSDQSGSGSENPIIDDSENTSSPGEIGITVNGVNVVYTDAVPFIDSNKRTLCPLRAVADALNMNVEWDNEKRQAIFRNDKVNVVFTIGSNRYLVNGVTETMDTAAVLKNSRTYAPVRYLAEAAGYTVDWDSESRTVIIES